MLFVGLGVQLVGLAASPAIEMERLQEQMQRRFGAGRLPLLRAWQKLLVDSGPGSEFDRIKLANDFFNRSVRFEEDMIVWGQIDYWATPLETMGKGQGDCEDYALAKYYTLRLAGVPESRLRLIYVRAMLPGPDGPRLQAHMVLAYYPTATGEPLILDNLTAEIRSARQRSDLHPVFSFNSGGVWKGAAGAPSAGNSPSRWGDLQSRSRDEGFE